MSNIVDGVASYLEMDRQSRILELHGERMIRRNFAPGFRIRHQQKDLNLALQSARKSLMGVIGVILKPYPRSFITNITIINGAPRPF